MMVNEIAEVAVSKPSKRPTTNVAPKSTSGGSKPDSVLKSSATPVSAEVRRLMIAEAAYYIAEQRGFAAGNHVEDWLLAEKQIDATLSAKVLPGQTA